MRRLTSASALLLAIALLTGCAASQAFHRGEDRARVADWDAAVAYFRQATQADPDKPEYRIALERAMLNASRVHFDNARQMEAQDQLDAALLEYRRTVEYDASNRQAVEKAIELEKTIRDRIEAARPRPAIAALREQARQVSVEPLLNPSSQDPIRAQFNNANLREILTFIANAAGINITYDPTFQDRAVSVNLNGVPLVQALNTVLLSNGIFYAVLDQTTIVVAPDTPANRLKYERQVAITIPLSYGDSTELAQMLTALTRTTAAAVAPIIVPNKTNNTITIRGTQPVIDVIRQLVLSNDKPRAEVTLDIEILEVDRARTKQLGLNLSVYQIGGIFSPEQAPPGALGAPSGSTGTADTRPFNLNTISQGVSTSDFYLSLPQALVRFLETDTQTKVLAQTQLRGAEGTALTFTVGAEEPYLSTSFAPIGGIGSPNTSPLSSYTFRKVGITVTATTRVTDEGDILLTPLVLDSAVLGPLRQVGNTTAPSFPTRQVTTTLRLRDGESHLLAGLLQEAERKILKGFPGIISVPVLKDIFGDTDSAIEQTDIVMLITPRVIRTHQYTAQDLSPIYLGTNQNFGLTGAPPLIAAPPGTPVPPGTPAPLGTPAPDAPAPPDTLAPPDAPAPAAPVPGAPPQGLPLPTAPQPGPPGPVTPPPAQAPAPLQPPQPPAQNPPQAGNLTAPQAATAPAASVSVVAPAGEVRVAGGPYMVPVYISGVSRVSTITVTLSFNPAALRVRTIQEGAFLRQGNVNVVFTPNTDAAIGRVDLTFVRTGDTIGASGSGLLAGILFDAVGSGTSQLTVSGVATNPTGAAIPIQFTPATVVVR